MGFHEILVAQKFVLIQYLHLHNRCFLHTQWRTWTYVALVGKLLHGVVLPVLGEKIGLQT